MFPENTRYWYTQNEKSIFEFFFLIEISARARKIQGTLDIYTSDANKNNTIYVRKIHQKDINYKLYLPLFTFYVLNYLHFKTFRR